MTPLSLSAIGLRVQYGGIVAVSGLDLPELQPGTILGLIGELRARRR